MVSNLFLIDESNRLLKMISLRILGTQEAKDELASLGENVDDFVVQTKSKIDQTVRNYTAVASNAFKGISVLDDNGNYRSTYEILRDISRVYQEIIETDKKAGTNRGQALLEILAGKNRSNVAASILQSPEILESAYESALNSAGSAQEELNKYLESAEAKVQKLKNQLQEFWNTLLDSGTLKTIIGSLTTILETATELVDTFGTLGTAGLGLGAFLGIKNVGIFKTFNSDIDKSISKIGMFNKSFWAMQQDLKHGNGIGFSIFGGQSVTSKDKQSILDLNTALKNGVKPAKAWATTMTNCSIAAQNQARQCLRANGNLTELANGLDTTTASAKAAEIGLKALSIAGNMLAFYAISKGIQLVADVINNVTQAQEKAIEKAEEAINKIEEQQDALISNKKTIDSISSDYEKLAKGVDSLGRNVSLSTEEYSQYNDIVNQIADMFPQMVQGYTEEGNAIIAHKGNVESLTKAYEEQKKAAQDAIIAGSADVFAGFKAATDKNPEYIWEESGLLQMKELVDKIVATGGDVEKIQEVVNGLGGNSLVIGDVFDKIGLDKGWFDWNTLDAEYISENIKKFQSLFNTLNTEVDAQTTKIKPIMQAYLEQSFEFQGLDEKAQDIVKHIVGQFDAEFYSQFDNETEMASWITENIVNKFKGKDGEKMSIEFGAMFDLQTQFNANEITVSEYQEKLSAFLTLIGSLPDETQKAIKLLFGIQTNEDGTTTSDTDTMINNVKDKLSDEFDGKVGELTLEELEIAANLTIDQEETKKNITSELKSLEQGGSVNLTLRPQIDTSELNAKGWDAGEGTATVYSSTYSNEDGTVAVNFTPIIADPKTGEYLGVLSPDELQDYAEGVIAGTRKDDLNLQIGAKFEGKDAIQQAEDSATKVHELHERYFVDGDILLSWDELIAKIKEVNSQNPDEITVLPDISQTIDNLNTRLKPTMDALKEAYQDIFKSEDGEINFSLDDVDISTFESIKSAIGELDEIEGIEINYDDFDNFVKVLSDTSSTSDEVQAQFDKLSTSIVYSADCTQMTKDNFDLLVKSLYEMGLVNAEEVLTNIRNAQEELKASGIDLKNATEEQAQAFLNEAEASDIAKEYLRMYMVQKQLANQPLNTSADVEALENLCDSLGVTGEMLKWVASLKSALGAVEAGAPIQAFQSQIDDANKKIAELAATGGSFKFEFDSNVTSPSKDKSSKDKQSTETFDFIETAIKRIEEAIDKLKTKAENTFIGFEVRTKHYTSLLGKVTDEINLQSQAYQAYMARANSVGLSEVYASQVRDGSLNIVDITDDKLKEQIKDYQTWYEKAKECQDKVEELKITQTELTQANLELLIIKYEKLAEKVSSANDRIQGKLDLKEAWGFHATSGSYTSMNKNIIKQIDYIKKQDEELKKLLNTVEKGSEAWLEYQARLDDNKKSLQDLTKEMAENAKAVAELSGAKAERKVEKYDKSDEKLDAKIDNSIKYKNQNKYLNTEMKNIDRRQKAYDNAVKTDEKGIATTSKAINKTKSNKENKSILKKIKSLVKQKKVISESLLEKASKLGDNGALYDKCVRYNAYISAYEIDKDIADLYRKTSQQDKADIVQRKLDNIQTYYKNRQGENNQKAEQLNARIEMAKESGYVESATLYNQLSSVEKQNNASLRTERDKLQESLAKSLLDGSIKKNSDEWYEMCQKIDDVTNEIDQSDLALKQYQNTLRQMKWDSFDYLQGKISNVTSEMDFMINELSREDLTSDDIGGLTDEGNAVAYLRASKYETLKNQLADYYAELETLEKTEDQYDTKVIERKEELRQRIQDTTSAVQDEKWAIIDLYTQGYEALSNKIKDLIDEYGELLDAEKEAYDWQNTIADKTKEIASIRKQLSAYANDSSEETKAKIQKLNVSLEEAEKDLKDSQYDKYISDTKDMLSDLQEDMDNNIQSIIDNLDKNFEELMASIGENATSSAETVKSAMTGIGYQPSEDFSTMLSTTLEGSTIKTSVDKMTTSIDNLVEILKKIAEENAKGANTTTASEDVKKKAISEQEGKVISAKEKLDKFQETYEPAREEMLRLKAKRDEAGRIWGSDSLKYNEANTAYENAVRHLEELDKERDDLEKAYGDALAELDKLTKYSVGSKHITKDQLAWTQDGGQELVYRSNDGAILTRLGEGDKVFTNEMSENLWKLAQLHPADFMNGIGNVKLPDVTRNVTGGDVHIEFGDLVLPDVTNSAEFANSVEGVMRNAICKNGKTAKCFTEAVSSMQMGRGIGNARLYK